MRGAARTRFGSSSRLFAYGVYLLSMLIFGTNGLLAAHISLPASQVVLIRTLLGSLSLTLPVLLRGGFDRSAVRANALPLLLGGAALGANWVALFEAYRLLNVSLATLIYYLGPMLILLLSPLLFREKLTGTKIAALCLAAAGLVCLSGSIRSGGLSARGLFAALVSALFYAALIVFNKRVARLGGLQTAAVELCVAFAVVLVYVLVTAGLPKPRAADLPYLAVIGLVNTGLAYFCYFSGLQRLPGQSVALISYVDPVSALLFSALLLHEQLTPLQILGAVLILGGAIFGELRRPRRSPPPRA